MKFGWLVYIIGIITITVVIGFWGLDSDFIAISLMILLFAWAFIIPIVIVKRLVKRAAKPYEELLKSLDKTTNAKVFSKTMETSGGGLITGDECCYTAPVTTSHFVSFEFSDGSRRNFSVDVDQYNSVAENETGALTYKENNNDLMFIDFQRQPQL